MTEPRADLYVTKSGPYTAGNFTGCRDCGWTSTERASPGQAAVDLANHLREHHAPRPKDGTD